MKAPLRRYEVERPPSGEEVDWFFSFFLFPLSLLCIFRFTFQQCILQASKEIICILVALLFASSLFFSPTYNEVEEERERKGTKNSRRMYRREHKKQKEPNSWWEKNPILN